MLNARNSFVSAFEQKIYNSLNKDLVSKYFLVIFTLSFIHSFWVETITKLIRQSCNELFFFEHNLHAML